MFLGTQEQLYACSYPIASTLIILAQLGLLRALIAARYKLFNGSHFILSHFKNIIWKGFRK